jgi:hypothetical protein
MLGSTLASFLSHSLFQNFSYSHYENCKGLFLFKELHFDLNFLYEISNLVIANGILKFMHYVMLKVNYWHGETLDPTF